MNARTSTVDSDDRLTAGIGRLLDFRQLAGGSGYVILEDMLIGAIGTSTVVFDPRKLATELIAYGEDEAASTLMLLEAKDLQAIGRRAHEIWSNFSGGRGPMLDKAICLAIVEHIEGKPRELKRKRRQYAKKRA